MVFLRTQIDQLAPKEGNFENPKVYISSLSHSSKRHIALFILWTTCGLKEIEELKEESKVNGEYVCTVIPDRASRNLY
jgi:hypothetical protein